MSTEVLKISPQNFTPDEMNLITNTVAKGATPNELKLFLYRCQNLGLDPLKPGQIYFVKYGSSPGTIVVGIEGFRARAARTGKLSGIKRGALRDVEGRLIGAWAEVYRTDWQHFAREEVPLSEYSTGKGTWAKMPETMIKKVAECAALRMAFPDDLGGLYEAAEMDQAAVKVMPEQPAFNDGIQSTEYCCPSGLTGVYGALRKKPISLADPVLLRGAVVYLEKHEKESGRTMPDWALEFIARAEPFIADYENKLPEETDFSVDESVNQK